MVVRVAIIVIISKRYDDVGLRIKDFIFNSLGIVLFIFGGLYLSYTKYQWVFSVNDFLYRVVFVGLYCLN